ncbi:hypothetical protein NQ317_004939 [Molorchus minor]|uniref:Uncharacterized protein n=1 Tax=Molorchus minor TaxID=1323400 RepID=A0ABQ9JVZ6_9CUCU|nr:hypothetical protein NQ317_004939 [Molorchus minor]
MYLYVPILHQAQKKIPFKLQFELSGAYEDDHSSTSLFVKGDIDMESSTPKCNKQVGVISPNPSLAHTVNNTEAEPETATWNPTTEEIALITVTFKKNIGTTIFFPKVEDDFLIILEFLQDITEIVPEFIFRYY